MMGVGGDVHEAKMEQCASQKGSREPHFGPRSLTRSSFFLKNHRLRLAGGPVQIGGIFRGPIGSQFGGLGAIDSIRISSEFFKRCFRDTQASKGSPMRVKVSKNEGKRDPNSRLT